MFGETRIDPNAYLNTEAKYKQALGNAKQATTDEEREHWQKLADTFKQTLDYLEKKLPYASGL